MSDTDRMEVLTGVLNLKEFEVVEEAVRTSDGRLVLTVIPTLEAGVCPHCGRLSEQVRQRRPREVVDLPMADRAVTLAVQVVQLECADCGRAFTPAHPGLAEGTYATERFLGRAAELVRSSSVAAAAAFLKVPEKTLERWYYDYADRPAPAPAQPIRSLGIDELSLKKSTGSSWR